MTINNYYCYDNNDNTNSCRNYCHWNNNDNNQNSNDDNNNDNNNDNSKSSNYKSNNSSDDKKINDHSQSIDNIFRLMKKVLTSENLRIIEKMRAPSKLNVYTQVYNSTSKWFHYFNIIWHYHVTRTHTSMM